MTKCYRKKLLVIANVASAFLCSLSPYNVSAKDMGSSITEQVHYIRQMKSTDSKENHYERVFTLVMLIDSGQVKQISVSDVYALSSLLSDEDDGVRAWAAEGLGRVGKDAKPALPELYAALLLVDKMSCTQHPVSLNSGSAIRGALKSIGSYVPPERSCSEYLDLLQNNN